MGLIFNSICHSKSKNKCCKTKTKPTNVSSSCVHVNSVSLIWFCIVSKNERICIWGSFASPASRYKILFALHEHFLWNSVLKFLGSHLHFTSYKTDTFCHVVPISCHRDKAKEAQYKIMSPNGSLEKCMWYYIWCMRLLLAAIYQHFGQCPHAWVC